VIKIEFPSENTRLAGAIGRALVEYSTAWAGVLDRLVGPGVAPTSKARVDDGDMIFAKAQERVKALRAVEVVADGALPVDKLPPGEVQEGEHAVVNSHVLHQPAKQTVAAEAAIARTPHPHELTGEAPVVVAVLDRHGVEFNEQYCGKAEEPFYSTGPREGQWKKRRGVDDSAYDAWYASQRAPTDAMDTEFDASTAFGGEPIGALSAVNAPADGAAFMVWVSEMLAAGRLTQPDINEAWQSLGLTPAAIFPPKTPDEITRNVGNLYASLSAVAGV